MVCYLDKGSRRRANGSIAREQALAVASLTTWFGGGGEVATGSTPKPAVPRRRCMNTLCLIGWEEEATIGNHRMAGIGGGCRPHWKRALVVQVEYNHLPIHKFTWDYEDLEKEKLMCSMARFKSKYRMMSELEVEFDAITEYKDWAKKSTGRERIHEQEVLWVWWEEAATRDSSCTAVSEAHFMLLESLSFVSWTAMQVSGYQKHEWVTSMSRWRLSWFHDFLGWRLCSIRWYIYLAIWMSVMS